MNKIVMVVDDSAMIRMQVAQALKGAGFDVLQAKDGQDAWDQLESGTRPNVVVCDVNMPRMNGIEFLEQVHSANDFDAMSVVMLTTEGQPEVVRRARTLGAKGWLVKPFKPDLLLAAVTKLAA